ncbi:hypothetical protein E4U55_005639 [Claviceps digitariae]|nr:hypothetical protein E4U55_005639 [Claviceps digitariae]
MLCGAMRDRYRVVLSKCYHINASARPDQARPEPDQGHGNATYPRRAKQKAGVNQLALTAALERLADAGGGGGGGGGSRVPGRRAPGENMVQTWPQSPRHEQLSDGHYVGWVGRHISKHR